MGRSPLALPRVRVQEVCINALPPLPHPPTPRPGTRHVVRMEDFGSLLNPERAKMSKSGKGPPRVLARDPKQAELPPAVMNALRGMTHTNSRPLKTAWQVTAAPTPPLTATLTLTLAEAPTLTPTPTRPWP